MTAVAGWFRDYRRDWLGLDVVAGLTAAAVVVPKAMAYATIAGLPLEVGLYTAIVPMAAYALLGTSRPLSVSTTTTLAILTAAELGRAAPGGDAAALVGAAATLAVMVGLLLGLASIFRLGFVANFISEPVLTGFKSGIGLVIVVDQLPKLLGVHFEKHGFFRDLLALAGQVPHTSVATLALTLALLGVLVGLQRFAPRLPAPLVAIGLAIAATGLFGLESAGVATVGEVAGGLPRFLVPQVGLAPEMWPAAFGIALMSFTETIAAARAFGAADEPRPEANRELLALGAANAIGGLFGAMPAGGGTSQTAVNRLAGARSQLAGIVTAVAALATLLLLGPVIALMPQAALAVVVVYYSLELIKPGEFAAIRRVRATEFRWALIAAAGVVLLGTLQGILVAVVVSLLALAQQAYDPPIYPIARKPGTRAYRPIGPDHPGDEAWPGLLMLRIEGRLFFANAMRVADRLRPLIAAAAPRVVVIDCRALFDIEYTALKMLDEEEQKMAAAGRALWLAGLNPDALATVRRAPLGERLGRERMFLNLEAAVAAFEQQHPVTPVPVGAGAGPR
jgi:sulfate permease, SulP family